MTGWRHRGVELRLHAIDWAETQIQKNTKWATTTSEHFLATINDTDNYGMTNLLEYVRHIRNKRVYATSIDLSMISSCLQINIVIYSLHTAYGGSPLVQSQNFFFDSDFSSQVKLWYDAAAEHYEPIMDITTL